MKIAFFGTGLMGKPMAERLLNEGHEVTVYNRTKEKALPLKDKGAVVVDEPSEAINNAEVLITMLSDYGAVANVLFGKKKQDFTGKTLIQMSTIAATEALLVKERIEEAGGSYCEAPVLGSTPQAKKGELLVLFGGEKELYDKYRLLLGIFGKKVFYLGEDGKGAAVKLALNQLIASLSSAFSASLGYIIEKEVDPEKFMEVLRESPLYAKTFDSKLPKYLERDFGGVHFPVKHLVKDVKLVLKEFKENSLFVPNIEGVLQILTEARDSGEADKDYSALYNAVHPKKR